MFSQNKILVYKGKLPSIKGKELFYKYKTVEMYRFKKNNTEYLKYWYSIVIVDKNNKKRLIPYLDIRTLPEFDKMINQKGELTLIFFPDKIVPKLFYNALKQGLIKPNMYTNE